VSDCIFCKIVAGEIQANIVYENERVLAFHDVRPRAPVHLLIIPKRHIATLDDLSEDDHLLAGELMLAAQKVARHTGLAEKGYRTVINCRADAGQEVFHLHLHVMGGRHLHWPPG
jgi:histidine triad (HIT) family protein